MISMKLKSGILGALVLLGSTALVSADDLKKITIADGNPISVIGNFEIYVPQAMGWWKDAGYEVGTINNPGSAAAVQTIVGGAAEFGMNNSGPTVIATAKGLKDIRLAFNLVATAWRLITPKDNDINSVEDLRGKTIGVIAAGGGSAIYLEDLLRTHGLDPNKDVKIVVAGLGAQAFEAIRSGAVDAYMDYRPDIVQLQNMGGEYKFFYRDEWLAFPDYGLTVVQEFAQANPDAVVAITRGMAMAIVFAQENPECAAKIYRALHAKNSGATTLEMDTKTIIGNLEDRLIPYAQNGSKDWGVIRPEAVDAMTDFLVEKKLIESKLPAEKYVIDIPDFVQRVNDFDVEDVKRQARECKGF